MTKIVPVCSEKVTGDGKMFCVVIFTDVTSATKVTSQWPHVHTCGPKISFFPKICVSFTWD